MAPVTASLKPKETYQDDSSALRVVPAPNLLPPPPMYHAHPSAEEHGPSASPSDKRVHYDDSDPSSRPGPPYTLPGFPKRPPKKYRRNKKPYYNRRNKNKPYKPDREENEREDDSHESHKRYQDENHDVAHNDQDEEHVPVSASITYGTPQDEDDYYKGPSHREDDAPPAGNGKFSPADVKSIYAPSPFMSMPSPFRPIGGRPSEPAFKPKETQESNVGFTKVSADGHHVPSFDSFGDFSPPLFTMR